MFGIQVFFSSVLGVGQHMGRMTFGIQVFFLPALGGGQHMGLVVIFYDYHSPANDDQNCIGKLLDETKTPRNWL